MGDMQSLWSREGARKTEERDFAAQVCERAECEPISDEKQGLDEWPADREQVTWHWGHLHWRHSHTHRGISEVHI